MGHGPYNCKVMKFVALLKRFFNTSCSCLASHGLPAVFDRDLKPTNVLLDERDRPVLMDLGSMNRARIEVRAPSHKQ